MSFRVTGLEPSAFQSYFGLSDAKLAARGVRRCIADRKGAFPDRIELRDAEIGERLLLLNYEHQPALTPYRASHAIFVLETARQRYDRIDEVPEAMRTRLISLRAFDAEHQMVTADVVDGKVLEDLVLQFLSDPRVAYLQAHYAKRGCYAARIERA